MYSKKMKKNQPDVEIVRYQTQKETGLSNEQIEERIKHKLTNLSKVKSSRSYFSIFVKNTCTFFNLIWLLIAVALICVGAYADLLFLLVIFCNTAVAIIQEIRAKVTVEKLSLVAMPKTKAIRNGQEVEINAEEILKIEQEKSLKFLDNAFKEHKKQNNLYDYTFDCAGCGLCASVCPKGAISYKQNIEGFIRPVIDENKCVHCGLCSKKCVQLQTYQRQQLPQGIMFAKRKEMVEDTSSSAGVFGAMATHILNQGGIVYAVKYDPKQTHFVRVKNLQELETVKGSKYVQADITKSYDDIAKDIASGKPTLVCGTPCQIAGLKQRFGDAENLYLIKFLCHGVPSQQLFNEYCMQEYGEIPAKVNFRKKDPVWESFSFEYLMQSEKSIIDKRFLSIFLSNIALNGCCYDCHFAGNQIGADVTIGDAWGVQKINKNFYSPNGVSIVLPHTPKGVNVWKQVSHNFKSFTVPPQQYEFLDKNVLTHIDMSSNKIQKNMFLKFMGNYSIWKSYEKLQVNKNKFIKKLVRKIKGIFKIK